MSAATIALALGTLLAVGALAFVLYPLFFGVEAGRGAMTAASPTATGGAGDLAVAALREIEFDRATGKLSESDYAELRARYTRDALAAMRRGERLASDSASDSASAVDAGAGVAPPVDAVEAAIAAYRASHAECPTCGPRPEPDALYCSDCGRYLPGACRRCGAAVSEPGSSFCASCGARLAA